MAQDLSGKKSNFVSRTVTATEKLLDAYAELRQVRQEWTSENYSGTLVQADLVGANVHLTPAILGNLMNTYDVIDSVIATTGGTVTKDAGYLTNLYNCVP